MFRIYLFDSMFATSNFECEFISLKTKNGLGRNMREGPPICIEFWLISYKTIFNINLFFKVEFNRVLYNLLAILLV